MPVVAPVGIILVDEVDDEDVAAFSVPLSQAVSPTIKTVDIRCTHEFFLNSRLDFIKMLSFD